MILSKIGYGTWPLSSGANGVVSYGKVNDEDSKKSLLKAYESGINVYDTSDFYGFGHVENILGEVFREKRKNIYIITKGGMLTDDGKQNFFKEYIIKTFFESLERLRTDYVDVYMLHSPPMDILKNSDLIQALTKLKEGGSINKLGISLVSPNDDIKFVKSCGFEVVEINYNILDRRAETNGLLEYCNKQKITTVIRTPLAQGVLSGKFEFNGDKYDKRQSWNKNKVDNLVRIYKKMLSAMDKNDYTDAQNCLRFCLSNPNVDIIIPGMKTEDEVLENIKVLNAPLLTKKELSDIIQIYTEEKL
jgi:aryl-alcohol dehydrogenase-like predicted oxidoreductase